MKRKFLFIGILALYCIALFVILTLAGMPLERILASKLEEASNGRLTLYSDRIDFRFPDRVLMREVVVRLVAGRPGEAGIEGRVDTLRIRPDYGGLFRGYLPVRFQGEAPAGSFNGVMGISAGGGARDGYASLRTDEFSLERFPAIRALLGREINGLLSADVDVRGDLRGLISAEGKGSLLMERGSLEARLGVPGLEQIPFDSIEMSFTLEDGTLNLLKAGMKGPAFSGDFQGDIELHKDLQRSRISLEGELTPGPLVLNNAFLGGLLGEVLEGGRSVSILVSGTLGRPAVKRIRD